MGEGEVGHLLTREPYVGLDSRTLGSRPELKADRHLKSNKILNECI